MDQVKVFSFDCSHNTGTLGLEACINEWLASMNGKVQILNRTQSSAIWNGIHIVVVIIGYQEIG